VRYQIGEDPETASEMLLSFANLMRYSINYGHTKVSLETDVEYVNDYLLLQKIRYNNALRFELNIPDELLECQVPKLLLQPIIENSIKHGFVQGKPLDILVEAERLGEDLRFTVRDNGAGISPERLEAIRESFTLELDSGIVKRIGLYNIQKVTALLYGPQYGLTIDSTLGQGTCVTLTMPYEMEED
jgi:two-component system sensor histidine kinase YesM